MRLNKKSPIPLYYQIADRVKEQIWEGTLRPGDRIPSERQMSENLQVSRMTVRQAVSYLVKEGRLEVKPGVGTFVTKPKFTYSALHLLGFTEEVAGQGRSVTSQVLKLVAESSPPRIAGRLELNEEALVITLIRLRFVDDVPMVLETNYIPARRFPGLEGQDLKNASLYSLMENDYGVRLDHTEQILETALADNYEQLIFQLDKSIPMVLLEGVTYSDVNRPVEYFKAIYRGDRFKLSLQSYRDAQGEAGSPRLAVVWD